MSETRKIAAILAGPSGRGATEEGRGEIFFAGSRPPDRARNERYGDENSPSF
jgi:hypothetical protein